MVREVSSPQPKLLSLTDPTHPALSQQPTCGTQPLLLHGRGRGLDGAPLGRVPPPFPAEPPSETLALPRPFYPQPPPAPLTHSLARPGTVPGKRRGRPGRGAGRAGLSRSKAPFARRGKALGWPGAVSKTPGAAAGRSPPPARRPRQGPGFRPSQRPRR